MSTLYIVHEGKDKAFFCNYKICSHFFVFNVIAEKFKSLNKGKIPRKSLYM